MRYMPKPELLTIKQGTPRTQKQWWNTKYQCNSRTPHEMEQAEQHNTNITPVVEEPETMKPYKTKNNCSVF